MNRYKLGALMLLLVAFIAISQPALIKADGLDNKPTIVYTSDYTPPVLTFKQDANEKMLVIPVETYDPQMLVNAGDKDTDPGMNVNISKIN